MLGLVEPWRVKENRLDLEAGKVDGEVECRAGEEERRKVRAACIDMWPAFEAAVARNYLMQRWSSIRSMSWPTRARRWTR